MKNFISSTPETEKDCAQTPWWFVKSLENLLKIKFELDACSLPSTGKAPRYFALEHHNNALRLNWYPYTFCNPPFSNVQEFVDKAIEQAGRGVSTAMIIPDNAETAYVRRAWEGADTFIKMPFRLQFERPNGEPFRDKGGNKQSPQFAVIIAWFTPIGLIAPTRTIYHDFRVGFYPK
jgi:phage N-6-adenine-methyltransferase